MRSPLSALLNDGFVRGPPGGGGGGGFKFLI